MNEKILFTIEGRRAILERLKKLSPQENWLVCERGFLDSGEGVPVTDEVALDILLKAAIAPLQENPVAPSEQEVVCQS